MPRSSNPRLVVSSRQGTTRLLLGTQGRTTWKTFRHPPLWSEITNVLTVPMRMIIPRGTRRKLPQLRKLLMVAGTGRGNKRADIISDFADVVCSASSGELRDQLGSFMHMRHMLNSPAQKPMRLASRSCRGELLAKFCVVRAITRRPFQHHQRHQQYNHQSHLHKPQHRSISAINLTS